MLFPISPSTSRLPPTVSISAASKLYTLRTVMLTSRPFFSDFLNCGWQGSCRGFGEQIKEECNWWNLCLCPYFVDCTRRHRYHIVCFASMLLSIVASKLHTLLFPCLPFDAQCRRGPIGLRLHPGCVPRGIGSASDVRRRAFDARTAQCQIAIRRFLRRSFTQHSRCE